MAKVLPPRVRITSPKSGGNADAAEIEVTAVAESVGEHPVTALRLIVDGTPFGPRRRLKAVEEPKPGEAKATWKVKLSPGKHQLVAQAESKVSTGHSDEVTVSYAGSAEEESSLPTLYILAVGVAEYKDKNLTLNYAAKDAQAARGGVPKYSKPLFKKIETKVITDKEATRRDPQGADVGPQGVNPDHVGIMVHNYRWRLGLAEGESRYDDLEKQLAAGPVIAVPTITLEGDANGAPHPEPGAYAKKFSGRYAHRTIAGGIGHNLPQEAPQAFAQAVIDVAGD